MHPIPTFKMRRSPAQPLLNILKLALLVSMCDCDTDFEKCHSCFTENDAPGAVLEPWNERCAIITKWRGCIEKHCGDDVPKFVAAAEGLVEVCRGSDKGASVADGDRCHGCSRNHDIVPVSLKNLKEKCPVVDKYSECVKINCPKNGTEIQSAFQYNLEFKDCLNYPEIIPFGTNDATNPPIIQKPVSPANDKTTAPVVAPNTPGNPNTTIGATDEIFMKCHSCFTKYDAPGAVFEQWDQRCTVINNWRNCIEKNCGADAPQYVAGAEGLVEVCRGLDKGTASDNVKCHKCSKENNIVPFFKKELKEKCAAVDKFGNCIDSNCHNKSEAIKSAFQYSLEFKDCLNYPEIIPFGKTIPTNPPINPGAPGTTPSTTSPATTTPIDPEKAFVLCHSCYTQNDIAIAVLKPWDEKCRVMNTWRSCVETKCGSNAEKYKTNIAPGFTGVCHGNDESQKAGDFSTKPCLHCAHEYNIIPMVEKPYAEKCPVVYDFKQCLDPNCTQADAIKQSFDHSFGFRECLQYAPPKPTTPAPPVPETPKPPAVKTPAPKTAGPLATAAPAAGSKFDSCLQTCEETSGNARECSAFLARDACGRLCSSSDLEAWHAKLSPGDYDVLLQHCRERGNGNGATQTKKGRNVWMLLMVVAGAVAGRLRF